MIIIDNHYFGNITYYKNIVVSRYMVFEQYDRHQKKTFVNRTAIAGANGRIILSVPIEKGRSQTTLSKDVRVSNAENWQLRHWRSILSSYNNSPWFKFYSAELSDLYFRRFEFLLDWNLACFDWTVKVLKLDLTYELSRQWVENMPDGVLDLRRKIFPGQDNSINLPRYPQVFENKIGFIADLSILDLLFCEGPKRSVSLLNGTE